MDWTIVVSTFVGAFLAAGTGYLFELLRERKRLASVRRLLKTAICDDLRHSLTLYKKVLEEWEKTKTVWFSTLNELKESRFTYQNNKDWIHVFDKPELRRRIFSYYLQSGECINSLEYQQSRKYDIEARLNTIVHNIKLKDLSITHDNAVKIAISFMEGENREFENLSRSIPEAMSKMSNLKGEVKELLNSLEKVK